MGIQKSFLCVLIPAVMKVPAAEGRCPVPPAPGVLSSGTVQRCCPWFPELFAVRRVCHAGEMCWWQSCFWELVKRNYLCPKVNFMERGIQTENHLKTSYFISRISIGQKEILVKEKNHHVRQSPEKSPVPQVLSMLSSLELTMLQLLLLPGLGFHWLPVQDKQQGPIWKGKWAGAVWQGLLWSHFLWWALPPSKGAPGELCWAVLVCAIPNHTAPSLFIDCL